MRGTLSSNRAMSRRSAGVFDEKLGSAAHEMLSKNHWRKSRIIANAKIADRRGGRRSVLPQRAGGTGWALSIGAVWGLRFPSARWNGTRCSTGALKQRTCCSAGEARPLPRASQPKPWLEWVGTLNPYPETSSPRGRFDWEKAYSWNCRMHNKDDQQADDFLREKYRNTKIPKNRNELNCIIKCNNAQQDYSILFYRKGSFVPLQKN